MSRDDDDALPPRRPRPKTPQPPPLPDDLDDLGPSTFRPASPSAKKPAAGSSKPGAGSSRGGSSVPPEPKGPGWFERIVFGKVGTGQLAVFCRQAASYLDAGVDLGKALGALQKQFSRTALGPVVERLQRSVRGGSSLADAFAREPQAFDAFFLSMIRAAEARGGVPETLKSMASHYEARQRLIRQARAALIYPVSVVLIALGVIWLLTAFVLPGLIGILQDMTRGRGGLPGPTRALMAFGQFMQGFGWWLGPIVFVGSAFLMFRFYRTPPGKALVDRIALALPVLGSLLTKLDVARMSRTLGTLLDAGVEYGQAIDLTADVVRLAPIRSAVSATRTRVLQGTELSVALANSRRFPPDVLAVVETGEETGTLPESLDRLAASYEEQVAYAVKNLGNLIQPLLIIGLGGIAFFIALAFVMAYVSVLTGLANG